MYVTGKKSRQLLKKNPLIKQKQFIHPFYVTKNVFFKRCGIRSSHRRFSIKKCFKETSQNSEENKYVSNFFINEVADLKAATLLKLDSDAGVFSEFCKILKNIFFTENLPVIAFSVSNYYFTRLIYI